MKFEERLHKYAVNQQQNFLSHIKEDQKMPIHHIKEMFRPRMELQAACHNLFNTEGFQHTEGTHAHQLSKDILRHKTFFQSAEGRSKKKKIEKNKRRNQKRRDMKKLYRKILFSKGTDKYAKIEKNVREGGGIYVHEHEPLDKDGRTWSYLIDSKVPSGSIPVTDIKKAIAYVILWIDRTELEMKKQKEQTNFRKAFTKNFIKGNEAQKINFVKDAILMKDEAIKDEIFRAIFEQVV